MLCYLYRSKSPEADVQGAIASVPRMRRRIGRHQTSEVGCLEPLRHVTAKRGLPTTAVGLAGDDENRTTSSRLLPSKKFDQGRVSIVMSEAVQIEPGIEALTTPAQSTTIFGAQAAEAKGPPWRRDTRRRSCRKRRSFSRHGTGLGLKPSRQRTYIGESFSPRG